MPNGFAAPEAEAEGQIQTSTDCLVHHTTQVLQVTYGAPWLCTQQQPGPTTNAPVCCFTQAATSSLTPAAPTLLLLLPSPPPAAAPAAAVDDDNAAMLVVIVASPESPADEIRPSGDAASQSCAPSEPQSAKPISLSTSWGDSAW